MELVKGSSVEQRFSTNIQRLEHISIYWGTYYRENTGTVNIELLREDNGPQLMSQSLNAAEISEGLVTTMSSPEPIEGLYGVPLIIRITADSLSGSAVSPMMGNENISSYPSGSEETALFSGTFQLYLNGTKTDGELCFSATGEDYVWTGIYYWQFVAAFGAILLLYLALFCYRVKKGKKSILYNAVIAIKKYKFLIEQLVLRDFKTKYKRSILGVFWSFLNPLLMMIVQYIVF